MRIFITGIGMEAGANPGLWANNLCVPLSRMGHELVRSSVAWDGPRELSPANRADNLKKARRARSALLLDQVTRAHHEHRIELFFSYFYSVDVERSAIEEIRALGIPTVNFYCNGAHQFHLVEEIAPAYDLCWVPELIALPDYRRVGANPLHLGMAADPASCQPMPTVERDIPVTFVGSLYADRAEWCAAIMQRGIPLRVFSGAADVGVGGGRSNAPLVRGSLLRELTHDWRWHGPRYVARRVRRMVARRRALHRLRPVIHAGPRNAAMWELFARSVIALNFSNVYDGGNPGGGLKAHVRLRDFELPMCRALSFPQYSDELPLYFDTEREVVAWRTLEELVDKIRFYTRHSVAADAVRAAGHRRAQADHTWERRFSTLFQTLGVGSA